MARIRAGLLQVGFPVPFDIYNSSGRLLLRRGHSVESEQQLDRLVESGLYDPASAQAHSAHGGGSSRVVHEFAPLPSQSLRNRVSVFERLTDAARDLDGLYSLEPTAPGFEAGTRSIVATVRECCALDSDAALAYIMLFESARYSLRNSTNAALLTALLLGRLHHDADRTDSAVAAALTMNLSILQLQDTLYRQHEPLTSEQRSALRLHPGETVKALRSE